MASFCSFHGLLLYLFLFRWSASGSKVNCPSSCSCLGTFVDCSRKGLIDVPKDVPLWVIILDLQNNDVTSVPEEAFRGLANLTEIDLSSNQIRHLSSSSFVGLNSLTTIKLHHNRLSDIPFLGPLPNLSVLILSHNEISSVNGSCLELLANLKNLDLSYNQVVDLQLGAFPNATGSLERISLNSNRLLSIEKGALGNLRSLEWLKINKNNLQALPKDTFRNLTALKYLELNRNELQHIESLSFQGLDSLVVLKLKRNNISQLSDGSFWGLNNIKHLHLDWNNISLIRKGWLYGLTSLEKLTVSHNGILEVEEDAWESCMGLNELDLTWNEMETLSKGTFSKLGRLKELHLDHNQIMYIEEGAFRTLGHLTHLELNHNKISWTIEDTNGAFSNLGRLVQLGLASNQIKSIAKKAFSGLGRLINLDLTLNPVTSIQENPFLALKNLQTMSLNSSSLLCDCNLKWLPIWLSKGGRLRMSLNSVTAVCGHPLWMNGTLLTQANPDNFTCDDFPKPYITEEPQTRIALKGANVTLVCKGATSSSSSSDTTFQWRKDTKPITNGEMENLAETQEGGVTEYVSYLHLRNVQDKDEGRYQCVISNHLGSVYSQKARITVHVFPMLTRTPSNVTVKAGSTARLECAARGHPKPVIAWQKDGGDNFPAATERRMHIMPADDIFFITSVKPIDMGLYTCTAQNAAGIVTANANLVVLETPSFGKPMEDKQTLAGETSVLECMASGSPKPRLNWTKDGGPLVATERHFFTADNQLLIIVHTQMSDMGRYVCEMSNTLGAERDSTYLTVIPGVNTFTPHSNSVDDTATTGIIIIAVVCCVVGTSLVWVVIIYQTRKRSDLANHAAEDENDATNGELAPFHPFPPTLMDFKGSARHLYSDSNSEHSSKDSGTGESAKQSSDELLVCEDSSSRPRGTIGLLCESPPEGLPPRGGGGGPLLHTFRGHTPNPPISSRQKWSYAETPVPTATQVVLVHTPSSSQAEPTNNRWSSSSVTLTSGTQFPPQGRCFSAEQLTSRDHLELTSDPSRSVTPSGRCATYPSSLSANSWSLASLHTFSPQEVPNDSGSFSVVGVLPSSRPQQKLTSMNRVDNSVDNNSVDVT